MANLSVANIRERIFNTTKHEENVARPKNAGTSNPFANMNGNLLNADVYVSNAEKTTPVAEKISFAGRIDKLKKAVQVGAISKMGETIKGIGESISAFTNRVKDGIYGTWKKLNEYTIEDAVKSMFDRTPSAKYYADADINHTKNVFKSLEAIESARIHAVG